MLRGSRGRANRSPVQSDGPSTDANNAPVVDPTTNVLLLVESGMRRQDDLRLLEVAHLKEISALNSKHGMELRRAETDRIDAIRAVDVAAVAARDLAAAQQAQALATQLATTAETMRVTVAATAAAALTNLGTALEPIQRDVSDLRRVQFEQQGAKVAVTDARDTRQVSTASSGFVVSLVMAAVGIISLIVTLIVVFKV